MMANSVIDLHRQLILDVIAKTGGEEWKELVLDEGSRKLVDSSVERDQILNRNVVRIVFIEEDRTHNPDVGALYLLSPEPYVIDCLIADILRRRYLKGWLMFTGLLDPKLRQQLYGTPGSTDYIVDYRVLPINYFPSESHLITFHDPWSFPIFYHAACNSMIRKHMQSVSRQIVDVCVTLGEYPVIRYFAPPTATHEASVLSMHLARKVQEELDLYAQYNQDFPPKTNRDRGALYIVDRSMDLSAPLVHEFTYQAMAYDLLPITDKGDKVTYTAKISESSGNEIQKEMEISERDEVWVANRHRHMKDTIDGLMNQFQAFLAQNKNFTNQDSQGSLNAIRSMLAGLPQFQSSKEAYSLNLTMAQDAMAFFESHKLAEIGTVEQTLVTGLDEDNRKPRMIADQMIRLLDDPQVGSSDRLRLIIMYIIYRDGLIQPDIHKLLSHAQLPAQDGEVIANLDRIGAQIHRSLKEARAPASPLFSPPPNSPPPQQQDYTLSRFQPALKKLLEAQEQSSVPQTLFPYVKPQLLPSDGSALFGGESQASSTLRSTRPTWRSYATTPSALPRQRVIVFMAGGATFSEARACYEITETSNTREVYLVTSHMLTPRLFLRQVADLGQEKRRLDIPMDRLPRKPPSWVYEEPRKPEPPPPVIPAHHYEPPLRSPEPSAAAMAHLSLNGSQHSHHSSIASSVNPSNFSEGKADPESEKKKKKKHHFWKHM